MLHSFKYSCLLLLRKKQMVFWNLLFPLVLGTMFHLAFGGLEADEQFQPVKVCVVSQQTERNDLFSGASMGSFQSILDQVSEEGEDQFLDPVYVTEQEAVKKLAEKEVVGIIYDETPVRLVVNPAMNSNQLEQSILDCFVTHYNLVMNTVTDIGSTNPIRLLFLISALDEEAAYNESISYTDGNQQEQLTYFFNLIGMVCMYACLGGVLVATQNQKGNSAQADRKRVAPRKRSLILVGDLAATILFQYLCICICLVYLMVGLGVDFGNEYGKVFLTSFVGCLVGICMGFMVGSIAKLSEGVKTGILMGASMLFCFLSGLMQGSMRLLVGQIAPWFNHVNPTALISDSFYSLVIYPDEGRYFTNTISLAAVAFVFFLIGLVLDSATQKVRVRKEKTCISIKCF